MDGPAYRMQFTGVAQPSSMLIQAPPCPSVLADLHPGCRPALHRRRHGASPLILTTPARVNYYLGQGSAFSGRSHPAGVCPRRLESDIFSVVFFWRTGMNPTSIARLSRALKTASNLMEAHP